jgi:hypothetical protein
MKDFLGPREEAFLFRMQNFLKMLTIWAVLSFVIILTNRVGIDCR